MLVSVLLANYNNGRFISECLESVLKQTYTCLEVIVVDDASTDNSIQILESFAQKDRRIKVFVNTKNKGVSYTKAKCVSEAKGDWACFLDPDDYIELDAIELLLKNLEEQPPDCVAIYSNHTSFSYNKLGVKERGVHQMPVRQLKENERFLLTIPGTVFPLFLFNLQLFKHSKRLYQHVKKATDQDLYLKLSDLGRFTFIDVSLYHYRIHDSGISTSGNNSLKAQTWNVYLRNRHALGKILTGNLDKSYFSFILFATFSVAKKWVNYLFNK